jgi:hypothetical protein
MMKGEIHFKNAVHFTVSADTTVTVIMDDGVMYVPMIDLGSLVKTSTEVSARPTPLKAPSKPLPIEEEEDDAPPPVKPTKVKAVEEVKVKSMSIDDFDDAEDLMSHAKFLGVNLDKLKKANDVKRWSLKSLKDALNAHLEGEEEDAPPPPPVKKRGAIVSAASTPKLSLKEILTQFDDGTIKDEGALVEAICEHTSEVSPKKVSDFVKTFIDDASMSHEEAEELFETYLSKKGVKDTVSEPRKKVVKKEELVDDDSLELVGIDSLELGDKVSVYWENFTEWYEGEVTDIEGDEVTVTYEDGESEILIEALHTKIKLLS